MQAFVYFIIYLCYENFAMATLNKFIVGHHIFENDLLNIKISSHDTDLPLDFLEQPKSYQIRRLTENETTIIQNKNVKEVNAFLEYLMQKRRTELFSNIQYYGTYLQRDISNVALISDDYSTNLLTYFNKTFNKDDVINDIDKQFVVLDLIETSNKLLFNTEREVISNMTDSKNVSENTILLSKYYKLLDTIHTEIINNKKEEMKYICEMFNICRVFPTYSDYVSDLLYELENFSDIRIENIVSQVKLLIKEKINFFKDCLGDELTNAVGDKLDSFFNVDAIEMRHVLSVFKQLLHQRHKFSRRKNHAKSIKAKAIRLLIDIVDKAFEKDDDDEILLIYIRTTKTALRYWSDTKERDISKILGNFIRYTANNLKYYWTADTKKEVRTLVEILLKSKVNSEDVYKYLLSKGSQYVNSKRNTYLYTDLI